jgi:ABC-type Na+ efflux pump permease subunit
MVFRALVWKELKSQKWMYILVNFAGILIMVPFLVRITGWGSSLFLLIQVYAGYLLLREAFAGDKQTKTLESLFATPADSQRIWTARVMFYGMAAVLFSLIIIFLAAEILNSFLIVDFTGILISPFTFILLGLAGILLWRVKQSYADIVALVAMSLVTMVLMIVPIYAGIVLALCILAASWHLASDKEVILMC